MRKGISKYSKFCDEWKELYNSGESYSDIAKKYNASLSSVFSTISPFVEKRTLFFYRERCRKYPINENFFDKIDTRDKAYILGLLLADGSKCSKVNQIRLALQERDKYILESIKTIMCYDKPLNLKKKRYDHHQDQYCLIICNKKITLDLESHGIVNSKTYNISYPHGSVSDELFPDLLRGILDGDGWFSQTGKQLTVGLVGRRSFLLDLKKKLQDLYNLDFFTREDKRLNPEFCSIRLRRKNDIIKLYHILYSDANLFLHRKKKTIENYISKYDDNL